MRKNLEGFIKPGSPEEKLVNQLDFSMLPEHVAVIMDGNGRWAEKRKLPRMEGHRSGAESVQEVVETSARLGIQYLTLYAFSKENWKRPKSEVLTLWKLLLDYLKKEDKVLMENQIKLNVIGQISEIPHKTRKELERVIDMTKENNRLIVTLALNYSGRQEILDAVKNIGLNHIKLSRLDENMFSRYLYTSNIPDPDLLIRTSGELRISNFLLWQIAYSEIWITPVLWPDFRRKHMLQALVDFQKRERRFGDVHAR
jgi:undecaprenyl diphosphate synthase